MLDHVSITVGDLHRAARFTDRAARFTDPVMAALRVPCVNRPAEAIGDGLRNRAEAVCHRAVPA